MRQQERESLRDYVKRFNRAMLEINEADDQVIMMTFQVGLNNPNLVFLLGKMPSTFVIDLLFKAHMNGEDALTAKGLTGKWKKEEPSDSRVKRRIVKTFPRRLRLARATLTPRRRK